MRNPVGGVCRRRPTTLRIAPRKTLPFAGIRRPTLRHPAVIMPHLNPITVAPARCLRPWLLGLVLGWLGASHAGATELAELSAAGEAAIRVDDLTAAVQVLADDSLEGREAGSRGGRAAAGYLLDQLRRLTLAGGSTSGEFTQSFGAGYRNLLAQLPGSDPQLRHEVLVVSAHYDHVGYGARYNSFGPFGYVHNGADDNASGVAALLEVIDALQRTGYRPRRTIYFAFWDAEEKGLLGSRYWLNHCPLNPQQIRLMVNLDMVGWLRSQRLEVYGSRTLAGSREVVSRANGLAQCLIDFRWEHKDNSDHDTFFQQSIPYLMFHTGLHEKYHRPSDDVEHLNYEGLEQVAELVWNVLLAYDQEDTLPAFRQASRAEGEPQRASFLASRRKTESRLGIRWDPDLARAPRAGLRVTGLTPAWPAELAGIRVGDIITACDGVAIRSAETFQTLVFAATDSLVMSIASGAGTLETREIAVQLRGEPLKLGITWRENTAEPRAVTIVSVAAGSPAALGGLQVGDRLLRLQGQRFDDSADLSRLAVDLNLPAEVEIERRGRILFRELLPLEPVAASVTSDE